MSTSYDVAVAGLGAMGSAAAFHLARRGLRVLGLDRYAPPHTQGSSHGETRIIREAYFEHPLYVPLVQRAYALWTELEELSGHTLYTPTGGLMLGPANGALVQGALRSAREHGLAHERLAAAEVARRFPAFRPADGMEGVWEPRAGMLYPEACVHTHLHLARAHGVSLRFGEPMLAWRAGEGGVEIETARGRERADRLVVTVGAWTRSLASGVVLPLECERQVLHWFTPRSNPEGFDRSRFPIFILEHAPGRFFYGFPAVVDEVKVAIHHEGEIVDPDDERAPARADEIERMRVLLERFVPEAAGGHRRAATCLFTNAPDGHFVIDRHPAHAQVVIASPCSGHGFKFASAIGELLADLVEGRAPGFDLAPFRIGRWS
jgi:sarcosine oxidase